MRVAWFEACGGGLPGAVLRERLKYRPRQDCERIRRSVVRHQARGRRSDVVLCLDEFGPLNLMPHPGRQWAGRGGAHRDPDREPRRRRRATYHRYDGCGTFAALDLGKDKLYGHIEPVKRRTEFLAFCRYLRTFTRPKSGSRSSATTSRRT